MIQFAGFYYKSFMKHYVSTSVNFVIIRPYIKFVI